VIELAGLPGGGVANKQWVDMLVLTGSTLRKFVARLRLELDQVREELTVTGIVTY